MAKVIFDENRCKGCQLCITACPKKIILMATDRINNKGYHPAIVEKMEECIGCTNCALICPDCIITVER